MVRTHPDPGRAWGGGSPLPDLEQGDDELIRRQQAAAANEEGGSQHSGGDDDGSESGSEQWLPVVYADESYAPAETWAQGDATTHYLPYEEPTGSLATRASRGLGLLPRGSKDPPQAQAQAQAQEQAQDLPGTPTQKDDEGEGGALLGRRPRKQLHFIDEEPKGLKTLGSTEVQRTSNNATGIPGQANKPSLSSRFKTAVMAASALQSFKFMAKPPSAAPSGRLDGIGHDVESGIGRVLQRLRSVSMPGPLPEALPEPVEDQWSGVYDPDATDMMIQAVMSGDVGAVKVALDDNADPNYSEEASGMTPMHFVAAHGRKQSHQKARYSDEKAKHMAQLLKKAGARMNVPDMYGYIPLQLAAFHGNNAVLSFLLTSAGRSQIQLTRMLKHQDHGIQYTALHCAVEGKQARAVADLLMAGASYKTQDYTSLTPWSLAARHHHEWAMSLISDLNIALAGDGRLPADAVLQLALELRTLEAVPVVLRAAAKWPSQVWQLMRAAIASGLHEFVELLAEDIATVCPKALLEVPWGDVMVELATRFPTSFQTMVHSLNMVDFETVALPFIRGLNFDEDPPAPEPEPAHTGKHSSGKHHGEDADRHESRLVGSGRHSSRRMSMVHNDMQMQHRAKSVMSLKSMLVLGRHVDEDAPENLGKKDDPSAPAAGLPEAVKYLLLKCMINSLDELDWRVWQAFVGGLHASLALEIARFPKLFKRLTDSIAGRMVPSWKASMQARLLDSVAGTGYDIDSLAPTSRWASSAHLPAIQLVSSAQDHESHRLLNVNHLVVAAVASRSNINVYSIVTAMDRWLALNPTCYLTHLQPESIASLASNYPEACRLLLSLEAQGHCDVKVPGHLCPHTSQAVYRCSDLGLAFIWQDDGLAALRQLGVQDLERVQRWMLSDVTFDAVMKLFKSSDHPEEAAEQLEKLLNSGLTGKDINKLVQLDTSLSDVIAALRGGLTAGFVHQMITHKISFHVAKEMLGAKVDRNTLWNNVRHQPIWNKFPKESYRAGITYDFIRIFFETWEEYHFDKRFIDLLFDFHDPLFVKLRTALEYVNSNKALQVSLAEEEKAIQQARRQRSMHTLLELSRAFMREQYWSPHRAVIVALVYGGAWIVPRVASIEFDKLFHKLAATFRIKLPVSEALHESPKAEAVSGTLSITNLAQLGHGCYLRALLSADAPASAFELPVVEALIEVKWATYGFVYKLLLLGEHAVVVALIVTYALLLNQGNGYCDLNTDPTDWSAIELLDCNIGEKLSIYASGSSRTGANDDVANPGVATLALDICQIIICAYQSRVYVRQLHNLGVHMWLTFPNNWGALMTFVLQITLVVGHLSRQVPLLQASIALMVLLQFLRLGWYAILNERLGALVRIITQTFADTMYFLFLLGILYIGFALAFLTLAPKPTDDGDPTNDNAMGDGSLAIKLFTVMLGDITAEFIENQIIANFALPGLSALLMIAYTLLLLIVAFNMLVAIMNDTFNRIKGSEKSELLRLKALVLVDIEAGLSRKQLDDLFKQLMGKYLHTLRPKKLENAPAHQSMSGAARTDFSDPGNGSLDVSRKFDHLFLPGSRVVSVSGAKSASRPGSARRREPISAMKGAVKMKTAGFRFAEPGFPELEVTERSLSKIGIKPITAWKPRSRVQSRAASFTGSHMLSQDQLESGVGVEASKMSISRKKSMSYENGVQSSKPSAAAIAAHSDSGTLQRKTSTDEARKVVRDAQRRVTRMFTQKQMGLGAGGNAMMTPAEALKVAVGDDDDDNDGDDDGWGDDELLPLKSRLSTRPSQGGSYINAARGGARGGGGQGALRKRVSENIPDETIPDYGDNPQDGYDSGIEEGHQGEIPAEKSKQPSVTKRAGFADDERPARSGVSFHEGVQSRAASMSGALARSTSDAAAQQVVHDAERRVRRMQTTHRMTHTTGYNELMTPAEALKAEAGQVDDDDDGPGAQSWREDELLKVASRQPSRTVSGGSTGGRAMRVSRAPSRTGSGGSTGSRAMRASRPPSHTGSNGSFGRETVHTSRAPASLSNAGSMDQSQIGPVAAEGSESEGKQDVGVERSKYSSLTRKTAFALEEDKPARSGVSFQRDLVADRPSAAGQGRPPLPPSKLANGDPAARKVIRDAQRRVTRLLTQRRMTNSAGSNSMMTPAEALKREAGEDDDDYDDDDDDDAWNDDELLPLQSRMSRQFRPSHAGGHLPSNPGNLAAMRRSHSGQRATHSGKNAWDEERHSNAAARLAATQLLAGAQDMQGGSSDDDDDQGRSSGRPDPRYIGR